MTKSDFRKESHSGLEIKYLEELRLLISQLGQRGGLISPSVYDAAQVLRLAPETGQPADVIKWLLTEQQADGGWGRKTVPWFRELPTLAAALALHTQPISKQGRAAAEAGFDFLRREAQEQWAGSLTDDAPAGIELLLPHLLDEAAVEGIDLPTSAYAALRQNGERKRRMIAAMQPRAGEAPIHSWEGWGGHCDLGIIDGSGGVGHSPAATAAWLAISAGDGGLFDLRRGAHLYLKSAAGTFESNYGLEPNVWPINRFEQIWGLHALCLAGLSDHPILQEAARIQLLDLRRAMRPDGFGFSDHFMPDGDTTATAVAVLISAGDQTDQSLVYRFRKENSFFTYPIEIQPSLTTTAHAVLALALAGEDVARYAQYLESKQSPNGCWSSDKWHGSWLYTTAEVISALAAANFTQSLPEAVHALIRCQREDGGWGFTDRSTLAETAYVSLALNRLRLWDVWKDQIRSSLSRAATWLSDHYRLSTLQNDHFWIDKDLYCPYRIDHAYVLCALIALQGKFGESS